MTFDIKKFRDVNSAGFSKPTLFEVQFLSASEEDRNLLRFVCCKAKLKTHPTKPAKLKLTVYVTEDQEINRAMIRVFSENLSRIKIVEYKQDGSELDSMEFTMEPNGEINSWDWGAVDNIQTATIKFKEFRLG